MAVYTRDQPFICRVISDETRSPNIAVARLDRHRQLLKPPDLSYDRFAGYRSAADRSIVEREEGRFGIPLRISNNHNVALRSQRSAVGQRILSDNSQRLKRPVLGEMEEVNLGEVADQTLFGLGAPGHNHRHRLTRRIHTNVGYRIRLAELCWLNQVDL